MTDFAKKVAAYIEAEQLFAPASPSDVALSDATQLAVLVAVSGGADSMALLEVLRELNVEFQGSTTSAAVVRSSITNQLPYEVNGTVSTVPCSSIFASAKIEASHFNHRLRGAESERDCDFVRDYCAEHGIACHIGYAEGLTGAENEAREQRYAFLTETAEHCDAMLIATAHNCDDNLETMLLNLVRGSGTRGLAGIPPQRGNIIRPLLCVTRDEIEAYLTLRGVPHVTDSTNDTDAYSRNKLRHHVLPVLRELNPQSAPHALAAAQRLREDDAYLRNLAQERFDSRHSHQSKAPSDAPSVSAAELCAAPRPIAVRRIAAMTPHMLTAAQLDAVLRLCERTDGSAEAHVRGGRFVREYDALRFVAETAPTHDFAVAVRDLADFDGGEIVNKDFTCFLFKKSEICGTIVVNPRAEGDSIALLGRNVTKSVKKLLIEMKIPAASRDAIPVVSDDCGVLAIGGVARSSRAIPMAGDAIIEIKIIEKNNDTEG